MRAFLKDSKPIGSIPPVALLVQRDGRHVGILHKGDLGDVYYVHLQSHFKLTNDPVPEKYNFWTELEIPTERALSLAAYVRMVVRKNAAGQVPYGFTLPAKFFDEFGDITLNPKNIGLTCATFVLAVMHAAGLQLVEYKSWPHRKEDIEFQQDVIDGMKSGVYGTVAAEHIDRVKASKGALRFKPLEVAAASVCDVYPVTFVQMDEMRPKLLVHVGINVN